jgi:hypothetical protein
MVSSAPCSDHPWIKEDGEAPDTPLDNAVLGRLKQFRAMNQFKKAALRVRVLFVSASLKSWWLVLSEPWPRRSSPGACRRRRSGG